MLAKLNSGLFKPIAVLCLLYTVNITLKSQGQNSNSMTPFYVVTIVFTVLVVGAVISFFISKKKKKN